MPVPTGQPCGPPSRWAYRFWCFGPFGFAACASIPSTLGQVPIALAVSASSAGLAVAIDAVGWARRPANRQRHNLAVQVTHRLGDRWRDGIIRLHLVRYTGAVVLSGAVATGVGIGHPYWAMVSALVPMAEPTLRLSSIGACTGWLARSGASA